MNTMLQHQYGEVNKHKIFMWKTIGCPSTPPPPLPMKILKSTNKEEFANTHTPPRYTALRHEKTFFFSFVFFQEISFWRDIEQILLDM